MDLAGATIGGAMRRVAMTSSKPRPPASPPSDAAAARAARLEAALRANLKRRKDQARRREGAAEAPKDPTES
jgi:hypothetical protein